MSKSRFGVVCGVACVVAIVSSGCEDKKKDVPASTDLPAQEVTTTTSQAQAPVDSADVEQGAAQPVAPEKVLDVVAARGVVDAWAASQNEGSFEAYEALYADRFTGVKRVGMSRSQYDRAAWLKDRKRMFQKKVEVTLTDVEVVPGSHSVVVRATQTWASGSYRDVGPKQLVLVPQGEDGALKIVREEMLSSMVVGGTDKPVELDVTAVGFALSPARQDLLVFPIQAQASWFDLSRSSSIVRASSAMAPAITAKLPGDVTRHMGKNVMVYGDDGKPCSMIVAGFSIVGEAVPHFGQVQHWNGELTDEPNEKVSDREVAQSIMGLAEGGGLYVAASLKPAEGSCGAWTWASTLEPSQSATFAPVTDTAMRAEALAFFTSQPGYKAIQRDYEEMSESKQDWASGEDAVEIQSATIDGRTFVFVKASAGHGCADFLGEFWALFEQGSDFVLLSDGKDPGKLVDLHTVVDVDGDESYEFVGPSVLMQAVGPVWRVTREREVPYFDCPC